jgi:hypothetical protein
LHDALQLRFGIILFSLLDRNCRATSGDLKLLGFGILTATGALIVWVIELAKRTKPGTPETGKA